MQSLETTELLVPFERWLSSMGRSSCTGWRWRRRGWIVVIRVAGRLYVSDKEIRRFQQRAEAGEFSSGGTK
jgi:hypothetical protein